MGYYYINNYYSDEYLTHHGILGQKWGKLNGPPYPIGSGDHSKKEVNLARKAGTRVGKSSGLGHHGGARNLDQTDSKKNKKKSHDIAKKVVIGLAITAGAAAIGYGIYKYGGQSVASSPPSQQAAQTTKTTVRNLANIKADDITRSEYTHLYDEYYSVRKVDDVNEAMEQAFRWNALIDKYGTTDLNEVQIDRGLDEMVKKHVDENADIKVFAKGQEGYRIAFGDAGAKFDKNKVANGLYVTNNPEDRLVYRNILGNPTGDQTAQRYEIKFNANKDIVSPSGKKRAEITRELFKDKQYRDDVAEAGANGNALIKRILSQEIDQNLKAAGVGRGKYGEDDALYYANWVLVKGGSKPYHAYADKVKKMGYNAILDDHDILDKLGKQPVVLLNAKSDIDVSGIDKTGPDIHGQVKAIKILHKRGFPGA